VKDGPNGSQDVSNSSGSSSDDRSSNQRPSEELHDYHAQPLPDPKLADSERSSASASEDSPEDSQNGSADGDGKRVSTDSSSGDDSAAAMNQQRPAKRRKHEHYNTAETKSEAGSTTSAPSVHSNTSLPQNIAKKGGIQHAVRPVVFGQANVHTTTNARLAAAPAVALPPFAGIGKCSQILPSATVSATVTQQASPLPPPLPSQASPVPSGVSRSGAQNTTGPGGSNGAGGSSMLDGGAAVISGDVETSSSNSSRTRPQIEAYYHINEDDMILMEDILMCPYVFRTQGAVQCGALAECVMPGMLRGHFSNRNKLLSMEMVYDAMGFMQQLERASGSEPTAQIIPGSLEMALTPSDTEARVIALAEPPYLIVNVSEAWTRMTKFTQMEAEGKELFKILQGPGNNEDQPDASGHNLDDVSKGQCTCSSRFHYDKDGREFVHFISSFPLTK
jgi:hypothetical protein